MLFDQTICGKCQHNNPPYLSICEKCKNHLRARVVNIDLWTTILNVIEEPVKAFKQIIFSEHKNFIYFLIFLISLKNLILARFFSVLFLGAENAFTKIYLNIVIEVLFTFLFYLSISKAQIYLYKKYFKFRTKDILAVNVFLSLPIIFSLIFIFPVEMIVFGQDLFSNNPYAYQVKPTPFYILLATEIVLILWMYFLWLKSIYMILEQKTKSIILTVLIFCLWVTFIYVSSRAVF